MILKKRDDRTRPARRGGGMRLLREEESCGPTPETKQRRRDMLEACGVSGIPPEDPRAVDAVARLEALGKLTARQAAAARLARQIWIAWARIECVPRTPQAMDASRMPTGESVIDDERAAKIRADYFRMITAVGSDDGVRYLRKLVVENYLITAQLALTLQRTALDAIANEWKIN